MRTPPFRMILPLILAVLVSSAGCSNLPTQPVAPVPSASVATSETSSEILGLLEPTTSTTTSTVSATTTRTLGLLGGVVSAGDFTVVVPAGALPRTATITVSQPDTKRPVVNLSISPASANRFLLPVLLVANATPMDRSLLSTATISYYNPSTGKWEPITSTVSVATLTVNAPLWHFSTYRVESGGKAGW